MREFMRELLVPIVLIVAFIVVAIIATAHRDHNYLIVYEKQDEGSTVTGNFVSHGRKFTTVDVEWVRLMQGGSNHQHVVVLNIIRLDN